MRANLRTASLLVLSLIFIVISWEPLTVSTGSVYLMNEYDDFTSQTYLNGQLVNNARFLDAITDKDIESVNLFYDIYKSRNSMIVKGADPTTLDFLKLFKSVDLEPIQRAILEGPAPTGRKTSSTYSEAELLANLKFLSLEKFKNFYLDNHLEYRHQNYARGQINHIGQVLNPINEHQLGRPYKDIYIQYGLGNTYLIQWTMDLFGGVSLNNYYKCYFYYFCYFSSFLLMLYLLFKDSLWILSGMAFLAFAFYYQGFIGFILAPGILPTIHFLDTVVVIVMVQLFRSNSRLSYYILAALLSCISIILNTRFGSILTAAVMGSLLLFSIENEKGRTRIMWLSSMALLTIVFTVTIHLSSVGTLDQNMSYFIMGMFSWPAPRIVTVLVMAYLALSYYFLFLLKKSRHYLKYIYVLIFIYNQGLLAYFYWSGLANHLPAVIPFGGLQLLLMFHIAEKLLFYDDMKKRSILTLTQRTLTVLLLSATFLTAVIFYREKDLFNNVFVNHKTYAWQFDRARVTSTIDPGPIQESIELIHKYSENEKGIYIISKYDNLLPFLSHRFSEMTYYEMTWHLFSDKEVTDAILKIQSAKPYYLFADRVIDKPMFDPWSKLFNNEETRMERASRFGRYSELKKIFDAIIGDYRMVDQGGLIAVYQRRQ